MRKTTTIDTCIRNEGIPFGEVVSAHMSSDYSRMYVVYNDDCVLDDEKQ